MSVDTTDYDASKSVDGYRPSTLQRNIGILSIAAYFPKTYIDQADLEAYDKVDAGKYTKGLMQDKMAFCTDLEDINSISMTVTQQLIEQAGVSPNQIGYLEVGTETLVDKSKSVKTVLMELFAASGNHDIEGVDTTNACYGGTAALFHAIDHCSAPYWDGRLAIVIAADIAVYDKGNARPTGGCGAIAMLIGPNAPLVFDPVRGSFMTHTYDFYKPDPLSEYPTVDGKLSLKAYITAVDKCYEVYKRKYINQIKLSSDTGEQQDKSSLLEKFDGILFHSPYCKLVRKAFARFLFNEYVDAEKSEKDSLDRYKGFQELPKEEINVDYDHWSKPIDKSSLEKIAIQYSEQLYQEKTGPSLFLSNQIGNMYTASLYSCLVAYLTSKPIDQLVNKEILLFSYGSGSAASMFSARIRDSNIQGLEKLISGIKDVRSKLEKRIKKTPEEFTAHLEHRKQTFSLPNRNPTGQPIEAYSNAVGQVTLENYLFPGTYYLQSIDHMFRRRYTKFEVAESNNNNNNNDIHCVVSKKYPMSNEDVQSKQVTAI